MSENSPNEKPLQTASFVAHATRGVVRDQKMRRRAMLVVLAGAIMLLLLGFTVLAPALDPHEHPTRFVFFWLACAWLTFTAILLAAFDLLMVRLQSRRAQRALREGVKDSQ